MLTRDDLTRMERMYRDGMPLAKIAAAFQRVPHTVLNIIREQGWPPRNPNRAASLRLAAQRRREARVA